MKRYNSVEPSGYVIGKASKYWTKWLVFEPQEKISWYGKQMTQEFCYLQNLSFDKDTAIQKMKEDHNEFRIDEELRGSSSFSNELSIKYNPDVFLFGKYKGKKFSNIDDTDYKQWYYEATKNTEKESSTLKEQLSNLIVEYNGEEIFIDDLKDKVMKVYEENYHKRTHLGQEGSEYENCVRLRDIRNVNTSYGLMVVWEFVDKDGFLIFYKGSKDLGIEKQQIVKIKGKIKHEEYYSRYYGKTVQETSLKYPKIVKK